MNLNFCYDLLGCLIVRIPILACGRRTVVPMNGLVSGQEKNAAALEAFNPRVCVVWMVAVLRGR